MALLHYLSFVAILAAFAFVTLSLASGLLYVSELIEEHSRDAKAIGQRAIYIIISLHLLLYLADSLPLPHTLFSILCHTVYLQNFSSRWPFISLTSPSFIASCVLVIADHFLWFFYFARISHEARHMASLHHSVGGGQGQLGFADIATFFGVCVWLAPLFLFLSLSAGDHALPISSGLPNTPISPSFSVSSPVYPHHQHTNSNSQLITTRPPSSLFKSLFSILPLTKSNPDKSEGLLAPRTPTFPQTATHSVPSSPAAGLSFVHSHLTTTTLPPPPPSPHSSTLSTPSPTSQEFRLSLPPPRRVSSRVVGTSSGAGLGPLRRATADSVGHGLGVGASRVGMRRSPSRGREVGYD